MTDPDRRPVPAFQLPVPDKHRMAVHIVYALYAAAVVFAVPGMFGVFLAYLKRGDVRGSYLESHIVWQIRTFWIWLILVVAGWVTALIVIGWLVLAIAYVWLIYRIIKGWLALSDGRPVDQPEKFF